MDIFFFVEDIRLQIQDYIDNNLTDDETEDLLEELRIMVEEL